MKAAKTNEAASINLPRIVIPIFPAVIPLKSATPQLYTCGRAARFLLYSAAAA
jgi:hypothetical protein